MSHPFPAISNDRGSCRGVSQYKSLEVNQEEKQVVYMFGAEKRPSWSCVVVVSHGDDVLFCGHYRGEERDGPGEGGGGACRQRERAANVMEIPAQSIACFAP